MVVGKSSPCGAAILAVTLVLCLSHSAFCRDYVVKPTGKNRGVFPDLMGVGKFRFFILLQTYNRPFWEQIINSISPLNAGFSFAHDEGNTFTWMKYIQANLGRIFVSPLQAAFDVEENTVPDKLNWYWRNFAGNKYSEARLSQYGDQFGVSFGNAPVGDEVAWKNAAAELRGASNGRNFFDWLFQQESIDWETVMRPLSAAPRLAYIRQVGIPENYVRRMQEEGINIMALWDLRCKSLAYYSIDPLNPDYWKERWETYRLMYIGGRWLAKMGITSTELYNEPDRDVDCIDGPKWVDDMRIRSQAIKEAFEDHNRATGEQLTPEIVGPPLSVNWRDAFSVPFVEYFNKPFPGNEVVEGFSLASVYSFHKYGLFSKASCDTYGPTCKSESGYGLRKGYEGAHEKLKEAGRDLPVYISEFNCFTALGSDQPEHAYFAGKHTSDATATAACTAAQIGSLVRFPDGPRMINIHKIVQTLHPTTPSRVAKNGILHANINSAPFYITTSTKVGEIYRLLCRSRGKTVMGYQSPTYDLNLKSIRFTVWGVEEDKVYQIYVTNEGWESQNLSLDMSGYVADPLSWAMVTAVAPNPQYGSSFHGEISHVQQVGDSRTVNFEVKDASFYMITVPKVPADRLPAVAVADVTIYASGYSPGNEPVLTVTSSEGVSVVGLRFDIDGGVVDAGIVTSVLQLHLEKSTAGSPQLLLVLGLRESVEEGTDWFRMRTLLKNEGPLRKTADNFINWRGEAPPTVVGHITVPPGGSVPPEGMMLRLDVTDAVKSGMRSFMVVRQFRFDQSTGPAPNTLPADVVEGSYTFTSREAENVELRPTLFVDYQVAARPAPPAPIAPPVEEPIDPDPTFDPDNPYGDSGGYDFGDGQPIDDVDRDFDPSTFYYDNPPPPPLRRKPPPPKKRKPPPPKKKSPPGWKPKPPPKPTKPKPTKPKPTSPKPKPTIPKPVPKPKVPVVTKPTKPKGSPPSKVSPRPQG